MSIINVNTIQPIGAGQTVTVNGRINGYNLPSSGDAAGAILGTDGSGNLSWVNGRMVLETFKTATGTSVDFTGIPSWVKRVTVMFNGVSTNGTSILILQIGAGTFETTGYISTASTIDTTQVATSSLTTGLQLGRSNSAGNASHGLFTIVTLGSNAWTGSGSLRENTTRTGFGNGSITLSDTLTQVRITTVNGTDTFDAGSINLLLEG
jgi:hypothetical protein